MSVNRSRPAIVWLRPRIGPRDTTSTPSAENPGKYFFQNAHPVLVLEVRQYTDGLTPVATFTKRADCNAIAPSGTEDYPTEASACEALAYVKPDGTREVPVSISAQFPPSDGNRNEFNSWIRSTYTPGKSGG